MTGALAAIALAAGLLPGCAFAVEHPAVTAGIVGTTLAFGTCKLASDDYAACGLVGAGAGAFLALVAGAAMWLGGDGHSVLIEDQAKPLPDDGRPLRPHHAAPAAPADPAVGPDGAPLAPPPRAPIAPPAAAPTPAAGAPAAPATAPGSPASAAPVVPSAPAAPPAPAAAPSPR